MVHQHAIWLVTWEPTYANMKTLRLLCCSASLKFGSWTSEQRWHLCGMTWAPRRCKEHRAHLMLTSVCCCAINLREVENISSYGHCQQTALLTKLHWLSLIIHHQPLLKYYQALIDHFLQQIPWFWPRCTPSTGHFSQLLFLPGAVLLIPWEHPWWCPKMSWLVGVTREYIVVDVPISRVSRQNQ